MLYSACGKILTEVILTVCEHYDPKMFVEIFFNTKSCNKTECINIKDYLVMGVGCIGKGNAIFGIENCTLAGKTPIATNITSAWVAWPDAGQAAVGEGGRAAWWKS